MSSIPALPSPASAQPQSGLSRIRQMLASDAPAIQPVRRVPGQQERPQRQDVSATDDALKGGKSAQLDGADGSRTRRSGASGGFSLNTDDGEKPVTPGPVPLTATPNAGFVAQSIHQDAMGDGLHIEPWPAAIQAYEKAAGAALGAAAGGVSV
ncbi:hypothetical protein [Azospirillum rugosum]|uniref:Uncharacterized protein n=1 Tax=Azospirillum rugosum TaxID=416170 RepID=A0ABS4SLQ8_9PROT|nr:hypothetical protein [Azospirillum rugosum]MBP2293504.1 hypothetical protein [Azospirillum rugosum]MDQ0529183.1 hypothetical protein [Azospirillum rugosum]